MIDRDHIRAFGAAAADAGEQWWAEVARIATDDPPMDPGGDEHRAARARYAYAADAWAACERMIRDEQLCPYCAGEGEIWQDVAAHGASGHHTVSRPCPCVVV